MGRRGWRLHHASLLYIDAARIGGRQHNCRAQLARPILLHLPKVESDNTRNIARNIARNIYPSPGLIYFRRSDIRDPLDEHVTVSGYLGAPITGIDVFGIYTRSISTQRPPLRLLLFSLLEARVHDRSSSAYVAGGQEDQNPDHNKQSCQHNPGVFSHIPPPLITVYFPKISSL